MTSSVNGIGADQGQGVAADAAALPGDAPSPAVSALRASIPNAGALVEEIREMAAFLADVEADIPGPTCPEIDATLSRIAEPRKLADKYNRKGACDSRELEDFASVVDDCLWSLPDDLERLRHGNAQLRDGVHHLGSYCHDAARLLARAASAIEARSGESAGPEGGAHD